MSSNVKPYTSTVFTSTSPSISTLGPGTLILANGTILPVLPPPQTLLPTPTILNTFPQNNSTVIVVSKSITTPTSSTITQKSVNSNVTIKKIQSCNTNIKPMVKLKPKYCLTNTTQVNKVPIPALTSRYANNSIVLSDSKPNKPKKPAVKDKVEIKKGVKRPNEQETNVGAKKSKDNEDKNNTEKEIVEDKLIEPVTIEKRIENTVENNENSEKDVEQTKSTTQKQTEQQENVEKPTKEIRSNENVSTEKETSTQQKINSESNSLTPTISEVSVSKEPPISIQSSSTMEIVPETQEIKNLDLNLPHSELSNDIFASLQVPTGCQNPESTSPTAAFLLAFPLVSSLNGVKVTEVIDDENTESQRGTPTLLQIGTMDTTKVTQSQTDSLSSSFLNLDSFNFFSSKDIFYNNYSGCTTTTTSNSTTITSSLTQDTVTRSTELPVSNNILNKDKFNYNKVKNKELFSTSKDLNNLNSITDLPNLELNTITTQLPNYHINNKLKQTTEQLTKSVEEKQTFQNQNKTYSQCSFNNNDTLSINNSYTSVSKNYTTPLHTNSNNYSYNYTDTNFNQNHYKNIPKTDTRSYYPLSYNNYQDYRKNDVQCSSNYTSNTQNYQKEKIPNVSVKPKQTNQNKQPINWMTTPDNRLQTCTTDYFLPPFTKEADFNTIYPTNSFVSVNQSNYFNSSTMYTTSDINNSISDSRKSLDIPLMPVNQRNDMEENQFSWSPTKIPQFLDPPHSFVPSTLPTLVGDLALPPFQDQKIDFKFKERKDRRQKSSTYENHTNFLSVSQLVDHNKTESSVPARTSARRNSGNRSKNNTPKVKRASKAPQDTKQDKSQLKSLPNFNVQSHDLFCDQNKSTDRNSTKNTSSSSYSAEALIGNQMQSDAVTKRQNYTNSGKTLSVPSFLAENIIPPYFPTVDLPTQDNNYIQQNQNYQTNSFTHNFTTSFQNNTSYTSNSFIPSVSTITTTYLPTNNFMHDMQNHDYMSDNLNLFPSIENKNYNKNYNRSSTNNVREDKTGSQLVQPNCSNQYKKSSTSTSVKKKNSNETSLPGFEFPFLSMPASINSPILPDDFHNHTSFLPPPTTPYSCKNPLYSKQNSELTSSGLLPPPLPPVPSASRASIQHPEISPSINTAGTSLTNFNLSAIFPEINKV